MTEFVTAAMLEFPMIAFDQHNPSPGARRRCQGFGSGRLNGRDRLVAGF